MSAQATGSHPLAHPDPFIKTERFFYHIHRIEHGRRGGLAAIKRSQKRNLVNLLRMAKAHSPFYARRLRGVDPDRASLRDIAPITKPELMQHFNEVVTDPTLDYEQCHAFVNDPGTLGQLFAGKYVLAHTSGSTGKRGIFAFDRFCWEFAQSLGFAQPFIDLPRKHRLIQAPLRKVPIALVIPTGGHYTSYLIPAVTGKYRDFFSRLTYMDILDPFEVIVEKLNKLQPLALHSYPTMLEALAHYQEQGRLKINPIVVSGASEPFPENIKRHLQKVFPGVGIVEVYAATEVPTMAHTCLHGRMHLGADWVILENVDRQGKPVPVGERGEMVYATSLYSYAQPIIRYELTDAIRYHPEPCPCGCPLPTIEVAGRTNDTLWIPDKSGKVVTLLATPILVAFMEVPGLRQYQLVQDAPKRIHINYVVDRQGTEKQVRRDIEQVFAAYLERHGLGGAVSLSFSVMDEIPRDPYTHKVLQVIKKVSEPEAKR